MSSLVFEIKEHVLPASHLREYPRATCNTQDHQLLLHVRQYIPKDNSDPQQGDVTIIGAHANGFPKELYEPLWEDLYHELRKRNARIRSIYVADAAWQGKSGLINYDALGNDPSWLDHARDIVHLLNTLRPPPPIVGVGHSFGGSILANVALFHPRLLTSLVLIDPVISRFTGTPVSAGPVAASVKRRDLWPSRAAAASSLHRSPFYRSWDPRVLRLWLQHGLTEVSPGQEDGAVKLVTSKDQEVFTYVRPSWEAYDANGEHIVQPELVPDLDPSLGDTAPTYPVYRAEGPRTLAHLHSLRPSVLYLFGGQSEISTPELQDEKLALTGTGVGGSGGVKAGRVASVVSEDSGHLIPMESPALCAREAAEWVRSEVARWSEAEREYEAWTRRPFTEKTTISDELRLNIMKMRVPKRGKDSKI